MAKQSVIQFLLFYQISKVRYVPEAEVILDILNVSFWESGRLN